MQKKKNNTISTQTKTILKSSIVILLIVCIFIFGKMILAEASIPKKTIEMETSYQKKDTKKEQNNGNQNGIQDLIDVNKDNDNFAIATVKTENLPSEYKGYSVIAKLKIPAISLETYVLKTYSEQALATSVTKFYGCEPNEIGNFCIAGHNYKVKNMFYHLKKLKEGDEIFLTDQKNRCYGYRIYHIYKVSPQDISCLSQDTEGKEEVTLITCTNDSKLRIIVKAERYLTNE